jgi:hypothetical protein
VGAAALGADGVVKVDEVLGRLAGDGDGEQREDEKLDHQPGETNGRPGRRHCCNEQMCNSDQASRGFRSPVGQVEGTWGRRRAGMMAECLGFLYPPVLDLLIAITELIQSL